MAQWNKQAQNYRSQDSSLFEVVMEYGPNRKKSLSASTVSGDGTR